MMQEVTIRQMAETLYWRTLDGTPEDVRRFWDFLRGLAQTDMALRDDVLAYITAIAPKFTIVWTREGNARVTAEE